MVEDVVTRTVSPLGLTSRRRLGRFFRNAWSHPQLRTGLVDRFAGIVHALIQSGPCARQRAGRARHNRVKNTHADPRADPGDESSAGPSWCRRDRHIVRDLVDLRGRDRPAADRSRTTRSAGADREAVSDRRRVRAMVLVGHRVGGRGRRPDRRVRGGRVRGVACATRALAPLRHALPSADRCSARCSRRSKRTGALAARSGYGSRRPTSTCPASRRMRSSATRSAASM